MKKDKEQLYQGVPSQIADFIEQQLGVGKGKGKGNGKAKGQYKKADIQAAFPNIDANDYDDVMGEALTEFMNRRIADGTGIVNVPIPPGQAKKQKTVKTPVMGDDGTPITDDKGNPVTVDTIVDDLTPAPYLADPAVNDATQTPDFVPPANPVPESNPSN